MYRILTAVASLSLLFHSCSGRRDGQSEAGASKNRVAEIRAVQPREGKVPNFTWTAAAGGTTDFDSYRGKATLVNFWATWCLPCRKELPDLSELSSEMAGRGVRVIGISTDRGPDAVGDVQAFVDERGIPYQIVLSNQDIEEVFGNVRMMPTTFVVDSGGRIVQTIIGARTKEYFAGAVAALLK